MSRFETYLTRKMWDWIEPRPSSTKSEPRMTPGSYLEGQISQETGVAFTLPTFLLIVPFPPPNERPLITRQTDDARGMFRSQSSNVNRKLISKSRFNGNSNELGRPDEMHYEYIWCKTRRTSELFNEGPIDSQERPIRFRAHLFGL